MNAVGKAGSFIIKYQTEIELALILIAAAVVVFLLIRALVNAGKKRKLLSQINDTVTEINSAVTSLSEKKSDVIYIDNRTEGSADFAQQAAGSALKTAAELKAAERENALRSGAAGQEQKAELHSDQVQQGQLLQEADAQSPALQKTALQEGGARSLEAAIETAEPAGSADMADIADMADQQDGVQPSEKEAAAGAAGKAEKPEREETEFPRKYFSRDCSISKNGKIYTVEELEKQIKE